MRILKYLLFILFFLYNISCSNSRHFSLTTSIIRGTTGTSFYETVDTWGWKERDSLAVQEVLAGHIPSFMKKFVPVTSEITDSSGVTHHAVFYASPDYLSIGTDEDWARVPLTPMAAQKIADSFHCFLPTKKMVGLIYAQSYIRLAPVPMYAFRDSSVTMWQHHLIIEGQRRGIPGLIAGIKKDVVISGKLLPPTKPDRVAIYGWHKTNGQPIQPLYTGHVNWYVDYSHGIRLVSETIFVDGKKMHYTDVLKHPVYQKLLCDEENCGFFRYNY